MVQYCHVCSGEVRLGFVHKECSSKTNLDGLIFVSVYNRLVRDLIHKGKYSKEFSIFEDLGIIMKQFVEKYYSFDNVLISFVPSHRSKERIRGFNQAKILANAFSNGAEIELIKRIKKTKTQVGMTEEERANNLKDAFKLEKFQLGNDVIIIDDVFTTGSTLEECAKLIKSKYPKMKVYGLTFAKTRIV